MPVEFKDYYKVLGIPVTAGDDDIKKAFRALARKYHPDVAKDKKNAEEKFKEINEANEVLSNPESRKKYDELGANWKNGAPPQGSQRTQGRPGTRSSAPGSSGQEYEFQFEGTGFSDFFEQFFGGRASSSHGASPFEQFARRDGGYEEGETTPVAARGGDIQGDILITIQEVLKGAMRAISVRRTNPRTGKEETETHQVRIPAGVHADQTIRVPGKGGEGIGGGPPGDIYLRVRYAHNPDWDVRGSDLMGELELAPWEAILGATVPVRTPEGTVSVKVAPGTQQGHQLRVRGKGLPSGANGSGDLYVTVSIQLPSKISKEEEVLWKQLAGLSNFNPRKASHSEGP